MCTVGRFSASIVSHSLGKALQHFQNRWLSLYVVSSENLKALHKSPASTLSLAMGFSFEVNISSHSLLWEVQASK